MSILNKIKENKECLLMIFGTLCEVGAVALALRNGSKAKKKLEELPEDATTADKVVAIAPYVAPPVGLLVLGEGAQWWARKINIDRIVSLGSAAALVTQRNKNKEEAIKETVDEETYKQVKEKEAKKNYDDIRELHHGGKKMIANTGLDSPYIFEDSLTGCMIPATADWISARFAEWQRDFTNDFRCRDTGREDDWVPAWTLCEDYFMEPDSKMRNQFYGWRKKDILDLEIKFYTDPDPFDNPTRQPVFVIGFNHEPTVMPSDRW